MTTLDLARTHRNQFLDAAEDAIAEVERLRAQIAELENVTPPYAWLHDETDRLISRLAEADALLTEAAETAIADTVGRIREYLSA